MPKQPRHILLVEDEPGTIVTLAMLLEMSGFRVSQAANGQQGLERLEQELPDLVLTDFMMPHLDGLAMITRMKADARFAAVPVILTSAALPASVDPAQVASAFLPKPFRLDALLGLIESLIGDGS